MGSSGGMWYGKGSERSYYEAWDCNVRVYSCKFRTKGQRQSDLLASESH